jgi:hypothetical protein
VLDFVVNGVDFLNPFLRVIEREGLLLKLFKFLDAVFRGCMFLGALLFGCELRGLGFGGFLDSVGVVL